MQGEVIPPSARGISRGLFYYFAEEEKNSKFDYNYATFFGWLNSRLIRSLENMKKQRKQRWDYETPE